ncbi:MAG: hypothetical protein U5M23_10580 [Marinagarivorans sp.]|nr:hypothetical protein [Marinagarivorans sp.]
MHNIDYLFVPVSSLRGVGEYTQSLIIAQELKLQCPDAKIAFVLNRHSPVVSQCPFPVFLVEDTPTKCSRSVMAIFKAQLPKVVIFDASGRVSQLKVAKQLGAKTVFISQHIKKRKKGLQLRRIVYTDAHYVVQPEFAFPPLTFYQKLKIRLAGGVFPEYIGPIIKLPDAQQLDNTLAELNLVAGQFILFNAGSGGHSVGQRLASDIFLAAAELITKKMNLPCVVVMGVNYPNTLPASALCRVIGHLSTDQFSALLFATKFAVISGGSGFLQASLIGKQTVVVPISSDQPERIAAFKKMGLGCEAQPTPLDILNVAIALNTGEFEQKNTTVIKRGLDTAVANLIALKSNP